jgi:hypothetical protein
MEIATRRDNVHLTDHGHQPALTKPKQRTLQTAKPVGGHGLTLTPVAGASVQHAAGAIAGGARGTSCSAALAGRGTFMEALQGRPGMGARALAFAILTAARSGEVLGARWSEIDTQAALWAVPPTRMKAKREHRVPLTPAALAILAGGRGTAAA